MKKPTPKKKRTVKRKAAPKAVASDKHVSIRKITNGWVTNTSWTDASGKYHDTAVFSKTEPKLTVRAT